MESGYPMDDLMLQNLIRFGNQYWFLPQDPGKFIEVKLKRDIIETKVKQAKFKIHLSNISDFPDFPFTLEELKGRGIPITEYPKFYDYVSEYGFEYENDYEDIIDSLSESVSINTPIVLQGDVNLMLDHIFYIKTVGNPEILEDLVRLLTQLNYVLHQSIDFGTLATARRLINEVLNIPTF